MRPFQQLSAVEKLFVRASGFSDFPFGCPDLLRMVQSPHCDAGTALMIFWRCEPEWYYERWQDAGGLDRWDGALFHVMEAACRAVQSKGADSTIAYDPQRAPVGAEKREGWARSIPAHMYEPVAGRIDATWLLAERKGKVPFHAAAASGDLEALERELAAGVDIHLVDQHRDGATAFEEACGAGQADAASLLLDAGAASEKRWRERAWDRAVCPSFGASTNGTVRILERLSEFVAIDRVRFTRTGLGWAAARGSQPRLRFFIERGARLGSIRGGPSPLMCAAFFGQAGAARLLLEAGADIAGADKEGKQALHHAVSFPGWSTYDTVNRAEVIEFLVGAGADTFAETSDGHTPLSLFFDGPPPPPLERENVPPLLGARSSEDSLVTAIIAGDEGRLRTLLEAGADPNVPDGRDEPLPVAVGSGGLALVELLLKHGAVPKLRPGVSGESLVHRAATGERVDESMISLLKGAGIDVDTPDRFGSSTLHHAVGMPDKVKSLLALGAKRDVGGEHGETALHRAALSGDVASLRLLLESGWAPDAPDDAGLTALHCAVACRRDDVRALLDALIEAGADRGAMDQAGNTAFRWGCSSSRISYRPIQMRDDFSPHAYAASELDAIRPPPVLFTCRPSELPIAIARALVAKPEEELQGPPWSCLFGIASAEEKPWARLNEEHPEPEILEVDDGMVLVDTMQAIAGATPWLYRQLVKKINAFFYTGGGDVAQAWYSENGFRLVPFSEVFSRISVLLVSHQDGTPVSQLQLETKSKTVEVPAVGARRDLVLVDPKSREILAAASPPGKETKVPKRGARLRTELGSVGFPAKLTPGVRELTIGR